MLFPSKFTGFICLFLGYSAFSLADALAKYLGRALDTPATLFWMYGAMLVFLGFLSFKLGGLKAIVTTKYLKLHILRGVLFALGCILFITALQKMNITKAYTIIFTIPFVTTILAVFLLKEKATVKHWWLIATGFAGVLIALRPGFITIDLPALLSLSSVLPLALFLIVTRKIDPKEPLVSFAFWPPFFIILFSLGHMLFNGTSFSLEPFQILMAALGGLVVLGGQLLTAKGYTLTPVAIGTPFQYTQLLWGIGLGYCFFEEIPSLWTLAGAAVIVGSGIALVKQET